MHTRNGSVDIMKLAQNNVELHNYRTKSITRNTKGFLKLVQALYVYIITLCYRASKHSSCHDYHTAWLFHIAPRHKKSFWLL